MKNNNFIENALRNIITISLGGPSGDPDYCNITAAAQALVILELLNVDVEDEIEDFNTNYGKEYIKLARKGDIY